MHRFFVSPDCIDGDAATMPGNVARQLARVLRARPGDRIVLLDGSGWQYEISLTDVRPAEARGAVVHKTAAGGEPGVRITLCQALLKADRFELVLQKGTELGVSTFVPMMCARSIPRRKDSSGTKTRLARWRRIIAEAAEQSGRSRIPGLESPVSLITACDRVRGAAVIPWEKEGATGLKAALARCDAGGRSTMDIFVGPEGGFTLEEIAYARARGIVPVSLGSRILRAETAGIAVVAAVLYELGELGG